MTAGEIPIAPVLRELRAVQGLPDGHPRRVAAIAAKDTTVAECEAYEASRNGEDGCDACNAIGPLLTRTPGTSGRTWVCGCGTAWSPAPASFTAPIAP